jgi:hypothetical protein
LKWGRDKARLAKADCEAFWRAWEAEGWKTALVSQVAALPDVGKVVTTPELAARVGEPNVTTR